MRGARRRWRSRRNLGGVNLTRVIGNLGGVGGGGYHHLRALRRKWLISRLRRGRGEGGKPLIAPVNGGEARRSEGGNFPVDVLEASCAELPASAQTTPIFALQLLNLSRDERVRHEQTCKLMPRQNINATEARKPGHLFPKCRVRSAER